jgi:AraC-like DNA-binding protein/copper chaperone CopZ
MKIYIRNMACESCKVVVKDALEKIKIKPVKVELGEAEIKGEIKPEQKKKLNEEIKKAGLELVESKGGILIEKIRREIIEYVYKSEKPSKENFSDYLSKKLNYDYTYLANIFSEVQATTIAQYLISLKIERAKEIIMFEDFTLTEIATKLHYKNLSHFSAQFKRVTGYPPSYFKNLKEKRRTVLQSL